MSNYGEELKTSTSVACIEVHTYGTCADCAEPYEPGDRMWSIAEHEDNEPDIMRLVCGLCKSEMKLG